MAAPVTSMVIVAHGKREVTAQCLASIERELGPALGGACELVLVDNASPDDTATLFDAWRDRATIISNQQNRNFAGGCNDGAAAARGDVLLFLNNDTVVLPGAVEALSQTALEPDVGAAGLRLLYPDDTIQHAGVVMIRTRGGMVVPHHVFHHQAGDLAAARCVLDLDAVTGACLAIRRELFHELGGFDEAYVNGWEDVDLCLRIRVSGRRVVYRGDLHLIHDEGRTRGEVKGFDRNAEVFYTRWRHVLEPDDHVVARLFDGAFPAPVQADRAAAHVAFEGHVTGLSAEGAEVRSLIALCEAAGLSPSAHNLAMPFVEPRLTEPERAPVTRALAREPFAGAPRVRVPVGRRFAATSGVILRLGALPERELPVVDAVWAASPRLRDELVDRGFDPERIAWVPPAVPAASAGPGGDGLLALLPAQDPSAVAEMLGAVATVPEYRLRALPSVATPALERLVAERFPAVELLPPCASEARFRELAADCDVVLCGDPADVYDRRALIAAGAGAAVVVTADGPAAAVLGAEAVLAQRPDAIPTALERTGAREVRAAAVRAACGDAAASQRLVSILAQTRETTAAA